MQPPEEQKFSHEPNSMHPNIRVYQMWQGNEKFFCGGRCVAGPNWRSLIATALLIIIPMTVYCIFVSVVLTKHISISFLIIVLILSLMALCFLFVTGCMDPGIIPRKEPSEEYRAGNMPKNTEVTYKGHRILVRYNETCHFYQPPRAHHCSVNDSCIEKFDHHCPWVGTTIGKRNYRFFLLFIFTASTLCLYVCSTSVLTLKLEYDNVSGEDRDIGEAIRDAPAALVLALYTALFFLFVGGLTFFHMYLVATNQTTYENFRYGFDREHNPYDEGCLANCASVWCVPIPASQVNFRAFINSAATRSMTGCSSYQSQKKIGGFDVEVAEADSTKKSKSEGCNDGIEHQQQQGTASKSLKTLAQDIFRKSKSLEPSRNKDIKNNLRKKSLNALDLIKEEKARAEIAALEEKKDEAEIALDTLFNRSNHLQMRPTEYPEQSGYADHEKRPAGTVEIV